MDDSLRTFHEKTIFRRRLDGEFLWKLGRAVEDRKLWIERYVWIETGRDLGLHGLSLVLRRNDYFAEKTRKILFFEFGEFNDEV